MNQIMLLSKNPKLISKAKEKNSDIVAYDDFMKVFEQLNFNNPDAIIFDFDLIKYDQQFMLESLPKKAEENYIKLFSIGSCSIKDKMADFEKALDDNEVINFKN